MLRKKNYLEGKGSIESKVARAGLCRVSKVFGMTGREGGASASLPAPWPPHLRERTPNYHTFVTAEPKGIKIDFEAAFTVHFIYI